MLDARHRTTHPAMAPATIAGVLVSVLFLFAVPSTASTPVDWSALDRSKLKLRSAAALVVDDQGRRIYAKRSRDIKPIASITKLMTAMVVLDAAVPLGEPITIQEADRDTLRHSRSRLRINRARLSRGEMLTVALMSSDNRAAAALARTTFAGGTAAFVGAMNAKAEALGMQDSRFADASGLDAANQSTPEDLVKLLRAAADYPFIRTVTTTARTEVDPYGNGFALEYRNTNPLVRNANPNWNIGLSKTGYINEAGRCLVMQARIGGQPLYIVLLDSFGKLTPVGDSNRLRKWLESELGKLQPSSAQVGTGKG
jgi:D-alanyl-D-alanine endopeptidase (penicillin-binding protein 7)